MKVLIMYHSKSGNTRKLAESVAVGVRSVDGVDCVVKSVSEVTKK